MWTMRWTQIELSTGREGVSVYHTQRGTKATNLNLQHRGPSRHLQQWKRPRPDCHSEWSKLGDGKDNAAARSSSKRWAPQISSAAGSTSRRMPCESSANDTADWGTKSSARTAVSKTRPWGRARVVSAWRWRATGQGSISSARAVRLETRRWRRGLMATEQRDEVPAASE
jgi:hypothetical protein